MGEPRPEPRHRAGRQLDVGQHGSHATGLGERGRGIGQEVLEPARQRAQGPTDAELDVLDATQPVGVELDEADALAVVLLGEGVRERRAGVRDPTAVPGLLTVQVTERHVVHVPEQRLVDAVGAADRERALAVALLDRGLVESGGEVGDERVGDDHPRVRSAATVGTDAAHRRFEHALVGRTAGLIGTAPGGSGTGPVVRRDDRVEVGHRMHGDGGVTRAAAPVGHDDRLPDAGEVGPDRDAGPAEQPVTEPGTGGRVVVAGDRDHDRAGVTEADERVVEELDGTRGRDRAVEQIAGDDHRVDVLRGGQLDHAIDREGLLLEERRLVELPSQVPVGGVQQPHGSNVPTACDSDVDARVRSSGVRVFGCRCHRWPVGSPAVLHVRISDHVTPLVGALAEQLAASPSDPFVPEWIAVPSIGMRRWLAQQLGTRLGTSVGRRDGIATNVSMPFPAELRRVVFAADAAARGIGEDPWTGERLVWAVLSVLEDPVTATDPLLEPLTRRVEGATRTGRAAALADLVDRYLLHRPGMVDRWMGGEDVDGLGDPLAGHQQWQPALVRAVRERVGVPTPAERFADVVDRLRDGTLEVDLPARVFLFGLSTLPPDTVPLLGALAERRDVHGFLLTPSITATRSVIGHVRSSSRRVVGQRSSSASPVIARRRFDLASQVRHPLLRSWGGPSRETAALLGARGVELAVLGGIDRQAELGSEAPRVPGPTTVLGRLQADLRRDSWHPADGETPAISDGDRSIQVHSCTGPARQVEVLRDALLHLLAEDDTLTEADIAVLCPRVEELAPVIQAVLGPSADQVAVEDPRRPPGLRYRITDRSTRSEVPLLGVLGALVDLLPGRFRASEVADLLGLEPVQERFRLSAEDLGRLDEWIEAAHIRWGMDGIHRSRWGLPRDFGANSWAAGLDRMLVSTAVRPDGVTLAVGDVAPLQIGDGAVVGAARVADAVRTLGVLQERAQGSRPIGAWCALLVEAVDLLCSLPPSESWQRRRLDRVMSELLDESTGADGPSTVELTLAELRRLLADRLGGEPARAAFGTGAVTFCSLSPLRSVPHRVVCILGLDQDAMPRGVTGGDDLLAAAPVLGDRDPRSEARQLLLEAVLSAQQTLIITCGGADIRTNAPIPPAVVVDELWDCLGATHGLSNDQVRDRLEVVHPRQPFDARNFRPGALGGVGDVPWSFDPAALSGAEALATRRRDTAPPLLVAEALPAVASSGVRSLDELLAFLRAPVPTFMSRTLQVRLPRIDEVGTDEIPVHLEALDGWRIGAALMDAQQAGLPVGAAREQLRAAGALPPGSIGDTVLDEAEAEVAAFAEAAVGIGVVPVAAGIETVEAAVSDHLVLRGVVPVHCGADSDPGPLLVRFSRPKPHHVLILAAQLLALTVANPDRPWRAVSIHRGAAKGKSPVVHDLVVRGSSGAARVEAATEALRSLVELWEDGSRRPVPLFDATSYALATTGWNAAASAWDSERYPESAEPAVRMAFGARSIDDLRRLEVAGCDPRGWALRLWDPLRTALEERGAAW